MESQNTTEWSEWEEFDIEEGDEIEEEDDCEYYYQYWDEENECWVEDCEEEEYEDEEIISRL
jgi:hypothetical protein